MKDLLTEWKKFLKEETDLALTTATNKDLQNPQSNARVDVNKTVERLREVLAEVNEMAARLIEIQDELTNQYYNDEITYHPGKIFAIAARKLADAKEYSSVSTQLNRYIENEVSLVNKEKKMKSEV